LSCISLIICMLMYGWSMMPPGKGSIRKSPVSESQTGRYTSVIQQSQRPYSL
jgi:hypothetical protein